MTESPVSRGTCEVPMSGWERAVRLARVAAGIGGPGRTRTYDQGIHLTRSFLTGVDYLITLNRIVRGGTL